MEWTAADEFVHSDYEMVLAAVPNYEGTELMHRLAMWDSAAKDRAIVGPEDETSAQPKGAQ